MNSTLKTLFLWMAIFVVVILLTVLTIRPGQVAATGALALAFEAHTLSTLRAVDHTLVFLLHEYRTHGAKTDPREFAGAVTRRHSASTSLGSTPSRRRSTSVARQPPCRAVSVACRSRQGASSSASAMRTANA